MKTIEEMLGGSLANRLSSSAKGKGGFFDLPSKKYCNHPGHEPPKHLYIPQGKGYRHICPKCGRVQEIIPQQITF